MAKSRRNVVALLRMSANGLERQMSNLEFMDEGGMIRVRDPKFLHDLLLEAANEIELASERKTDG